MEARSQDRNVYGTRLNPVIEAALSPRRLQVAQLLVNGMADCEIGQLLGLKVSTVRSTIRNMRLKYGLRSRVQLAVELLNGLVPRDSFTVTEKGARSNEQFAPSQSPF